MPWRWRRSLLHLSLGVAALACSACGSTASSPGSSSSRLLVLVEHDASLGVAYLTASVDVELNSTSTSTSATTTRTRARWYETTVEARTLFGPAGRVETPLELDLNPVWTRAQTVSADGRYRFFLRVDALSRDRVVVGAGRVELVSEASARAKEVRLRLGPPSALDPGSEEAEGRGRCPDNDAGVEGDPAEDCVDELPTEGPDGGPGPSVPAESIIKEVQVLEAQPIDSADFVAIDGAELWLDPVAAGSSDGPNASEDADGLSGEEPAEAVLARWLVFASGVLSSTHDGDRSAEARLVLDGQELDRFSHQTLGDDGSGAGFLRFALVHWPAGSREARRVAVEARAAEGKTQVRDLRLVAMRLSADMRVEHYERLQPERRRGARIELASVEVPPAGEASEGSADKAYIVLAQATMTEAPGNDTATLWLEDSSAASAIPLGHAYAASRRAEVPVFMARWVNPSAEATRFSLRATTSRTGSIERWWDDRYRRRQWLSVRAAAGAEVPAGYAVSVTVDHEALVRRGEAAADGSDLRVVRRGSAEALAHVLDPDSRYNDKATRLWFRVTAPIVAEGTDDAYALYHEGPAEAPPRASHDAVFLFFDDFQQAGTEVDRQRWDFDGRGGRVADGRLSLGPADRLRSTPRTPFGLATVWEAKLSLDQPSPTLRYWGAGDPLSSSWLGFLSTPEGHRVGRIVQEIDPETSPFEGLTAGKDHALAMVYNDKPVVFRVGEVVVGVAGAPQSGSAQASLVIDLQNSDPAAVASYDWVRVRPFVEPEPTVTLVRGEGLPGTGESTFGFVRLLAFSTERFGRVLGAQDVELRETTGEAFQPTSRLEVLPSTSSGDHLVIQSARISGASSDTARKSGELRLDERPVLMTNHRINRDGSLLDGYHHTAGVAYRLLSRGRHLLENGHRSPDGIRVEAADSVILVLELPSQ